VELIVSGFFTINLQVINAPFDVQVQQPTTVKLCEAFTFRILVKNNLSTNERIRVVLQCDDNFVVTGAMSTRIEVWILQYCTFNLLNINLIIIYSCYRCDKLQSCMS